MDTIINHDDYVLGDGFVIAIEFDFLNDRDLHILDGRLVHELLAYVDRSIFEIVGLGEDP